MQTSLRCAVLAAWFIGGAAALAADNGALKTEVTRMFSDGWIGGDDALFKAESHLFKAKDLAPQDARPLYSFALVQLKCHKFTEARATLDKLIKQFPNELPALQTRVWLTAYQRDYEETLSSLTALAAKLPKEDSSSSKNGRAALDVVKFLGGMFGFLEGPAPDHLPDDKVKDAEKKVRDAMSSDRRTVFDAARDEVAKKFADAQAEKNSTQDASKAAEAQQKADDQAKIPADRQAVQTDRAAVDQQLSSAKAAYDASLKPLQDKIAPLKADYDRLSNQARPLQQKIQNAERDASNKENQANTTKDKNQANNLRNDAKRIRDGVNNDRRQLDQLQGQARNLQGQYNQLEGQANALTQQYRAQTGKLNATSGQLAGKERGLSQRERDDAQPATGETGAVKSLETKLTALATYVPLLLDDEKQRVLDSFEPPKETSGFE